MLGRALITISALGQILGPFIADFDHTHIYNPKWPPHAKFHNGQTMSMGACLGVTSLYYAYRATPNAAVAADSIMTAALISSLYWVTGMSAILYPGSRGMDPEFGDSYFPQFRLFAGLLACSWAGWWFGLSKQKLGSGLNPGVGKRWSKSVTLSHWASAVSLVWASYGIAVGFYALLSPRGAAHLVGIELEPPANNISASSCRTEAYVSIFGGRNISLGLAIWAFYLNNMPTAMGILWLCSLAGGAVDLFVVYLWSTPDKALGHAIGASVMGIIGWSLSSQRQGKHATQ